MQHIGNRNNIKAVVLDCVQLVDIMAVKHKIEVIQLEHVTRNNVWQKLFQRRSAAAYLQDRKRRRIGKLFELVTVKFAIPEKKIFVSVEPSAVTQCGGTIFRLFAPQNRCRAAHLIARMYSEPANSEITGTLSRSRPRAFNRSITRTGVLGWRESKGAIRTSR